jgi:hypothetical protein
MGPLTQPIDTCGVNGLPRRAEDLLSLSWRCSLIGGYLRTGHTGPSY